MISLGLTMIRVSIFWKKFCRNQLISKYGFFQIIKSFLNHRRLNDHPYNVLIRDCLVPTTENTTEMDMYKSSTEAKNRNMLKSILMGVAFTGRH